MRLIASLLTLLVPCAAFAARPNELVQAQLLADVEAIAPGEPFTLGILLKIKPQWHIYWKYPGDSGSPTQVEFVLPEGFKVEALRFPIPKQFEQPGEMIGYGYEDEVMLLARVTPPAELKSSADIVANVKWLSCADVCIAGKAALTISLPVSDARKPANEELFAKWTSRLPRAATEEVTIDRAGAGGRFIATIKLIDGGKDVQWIPNPPPRVGIDDSQTNTRGSESSFTFSLLPKAKGPEPMSFLIAYTTADGKRQGVEFTVNLPPDSPSPAGS